MLILVMMIPSLFALGMTYHYYNSLPSNLQTILTTSVKTVLVYHMLINLSSHISLSSSVIYDMFNNHHNDQKEALENKTISNSLLMSENCVWTVPYSMISFQYPAAMLFIAFAEFQIFRTALEFYPHEFLALNLEAMVYPMILSVPTIACLIMVISLMTEGTLCYKRILRTELYYIQIPLHDRFHVTHHDPFDIMKVTIITLELIIQVKRKWKKIKSCTFLVRHNNRVQPIPDPSVVTNNSENNNQTNSSNRTNLGFVVTIMVISVPFMVARYLTEFSGAYLDVILLDMVRWYTPLHWMVSKQEIKDYVHHKLTQFKSNFGYY